MLFRHCPASSTVQSTHRLQASVQLLLLRQLQAADDSENYTVCVVQFTTELATAGTQTFWKFSGTLNSVTNSM